MEEICDITKERLPLKEWFDKSGELAIYNNNVDKEIKKKERIFLSQKKQLLKINNIDSVLLPKKTKLNMIYKDGKLWHTLKGSISVSNNNELVLWSGGVGKRKTFYNLKFPIYVCDTDKCKELIDFVKKHKQINYKFFGFESNDFYEKANYLRFIYKQYESAVRIDIRKYYNEVYDYLSSLGKHCNHCNSKSVVIDHIKSIRRGGTNSLNNLQFLCGGCNTRKM